MRTRSPLRATSLMESLEERDMAGSRWDGMDAVWGKEARRFHVEAERSYLPFDFEPSFFCRRHWEEKRWERSQRLRQTFKSLFESRTSFG
jgi:hypothetical protein